MSFPQVAAVNGGGDTVDATNHTVNLPAGIAAGNLLLVFFASDDDAENITFPGDWTQLFQVSGSTYMTFGAWYKVADGTEGATINVTTATAEMTAHTSFRITGFSGTPEAGVSVTATSVSPNSPNLTPSWGALDTLWFAVEGNDDGTTLVSNWPANYGNNRNDKGLNSAGCAVGTCRRELNAASEDPGVFTIDASERWVANTVAIKPVLLPTVTTAEATDVEEETATAPGEITAIGGANATIRGFKYGLTPGARTWDMHEDGDFGIGVFHEHLVGLSKGELYYFEAYATNPAGTSYGAEKSFLTKPDEPTALAVVPGDEHIALSWTEGAGSQKTMIRFRTDGVYPTGTTNGTQAFFDVGSTFDHTGLTNGTTYKYRAWSYASEILLSRYSDLYESITVRPFVRPTDLVAVPGDTHNELTWDKGIGSDKTMIRFRIDGVYPTGPANGTEAYFDTGESYDHTALTNGVTYKYRAWSYASGFYSALYVSTEAVPMAPPPPAPGNYKVEIRDSTGALVAILEKVYKVTLEETVNAPEVLSFYCPADDSKLDYATRLVELWVRDMKRGTIKAKAQLLIREDTR